MYTTIAFLYVAVRFVYPLPISLGKRVLFGIFILFAAKYHFITELVFGNMWSPELPYAAVVALGWLFCSFALLFIFTIISDFILLLAFFSTSRATHRKLGTGVRLSAACAASLAAALGVYQAVQLPEVHRVELEIGGLPPDLNGFRFVQLTDLHISRIFQAPWVRGVVERTNELSPDLIVITGDLIDGSVSARELDVAPLGDLYSPNGVIGVPGNHEYYFDYTQWARKFESLGIKMLTNEHIVLRPNTSDLLIAGVTDAAATNYGFDGPDLKRALDGAPTDAPTILLSHRPEGSISNAAAGVDVQLSGHTHGGMIRFLRFLAGPANEGFVSRDYEVNGMKLYVSNGTGLWIGFPIRLGVPSEITEFTLRPKR